MTTIKELLISSIDQPAQIKIEKNSKGYNYEINHHAEDLRSCWAEVLEAKKMIEAELFGSVQA